MNWLKWGAWLIFVFTIYWKGSDGESTAGTTESLTTDQSENGVDSDTTTSSGTDATTDQTVNSSGTPAANEDSNFTFPDIFNFKSDEKRDLENSSFKDLTPFFLFPILPLLFPKDPEEPLKEDTKNETKREGDGKPFIFFDFTFNIRKIPLSNITDSSKDSKIINVKKLDESKPSGEFKRSPTKKRKRRNIPKRDKAAFFDDFPLFPDSELDEFFPKTDLFFPDLPFHHKPKKLSRRKRDMKKLEPKNQLNTDLKLILDAFDQTFIRTKKELDRKDPILSFLTEGGSEKKDSRDASTLPAKDQEAPMIIVDKVVKIGELHLHDDEHKEKETKRETNGVKGKFLEEDNDKLKLEADEQTKNILKSIKEITNRKRNSKVESKEIKILPQADTSFLTVGNNATIEVKKKSEDKFNSTQKGTLLRMIDSIKGRINRELMEGPSLERLKRTNDRSNKPAYDDLKRNISEVLNQFLTLVKKLEADDLVDAESFDWTEKETLQNSRKESRGRKQKDFDEEYADMEKKEKQVADLNYLFLTVTLPTVCIFALLLMVCFFNLQIKGKICTKLFKPPQVFIVEDELSSKLPNKNPARVKKTQPI